MSDATVWWHDDCLLHQPPAGFFESGPHPWLEVAEAHPENDVRLRNMRSVLKAAPIASSLRWRSAEAASEDDLRLFHTAEHVAHIRDACHAPGVTQVVPATFAADGTWRAILAAAGSAVAATDAALRDGGLHYCLVRPPGHHAAPDRADGYCFMNNAGIAVRRALATGARRVAVIDVDVHHGNGTQQGFYADADVLTISVHMDHRGWGDERAREFGTIDEVGEGAGTGTNLNVPLPFGSGDATYAAVFARVIGPAVRAFRPDLLVLVSGQDAGQFDPNGRMALTAEGFRAIGAAVRAIADHVAAPIVATQEGGYAASHSALCLLGLMAGLLGAPLGAEDPLSYLPDAAGAADVLDALQQHPAVRPQGSNE